MKKSGVLSKVLLLTLLSLMSAAPVLWGSEQAHTATPPAEQAALSKADDTLKRFMDGNHRFSSDQPSHRSCGAPRRMELINGQAPSAVVLSCSDSRIPPELVFDQGLGDIFAVRVAGNIADPIALGSVEYAVEHLHVPLVIVLGHDRCGAVAATIQGGKPAGNLRAIVAKIAPAVKKAKTSGKKDDELLNAAIDENVWNVVAGLTRDSKIIKHLVDGKKLKLVAARYGLSSGKVELLYPAKTIKRGP